MAEEVTLKVNVETGKAVNDLNKLDKATGEVAKETNAMAIASSKGAKSLGDLERASEDLTTRLKGAEFGTPEFNELNQALKDVNRQVKNTELNMEALDNEQVASEIGSVAGAVGDMSAAFVLLGGDEDSSMAETMARMEKAIGITMAFKGGIEGFISFQKLWNNTLKKTAVIQGIVTAATAAWSFVTKGATLVTKALRLALLSLPFVAIGAAIVGLISYWDSLVSGIKSGLKWLGLYDDSEEKAQARTKARLKEERRLRKLRLKQIENDAKREQSIHDNRINGLDNEIKIAKSLGKSTIDLERQKLKAVIEFHKGQRPLIEESIALKRKDIELEIARLESYGSLGKKLHKVEAKLLEQKAKLLELSEEQQTATKAIEDAEVSLLVFENEIITEKREKRKKAREEKKKETDKEAEEDIKAAQEKADKEVEIERKRIQNIQKLEDELFASIEKLDEEARQRQQTEQQNEIDAVNEKYFALINNTRLGEEEILRLKAQLKEEEALINDKFAKEQAQKDREVKDAKTQLALDGLTAVMDLTSAFAKDNEASQRKAFEINKKLQIAQALIQTYQGVQAIFASASANPITVGFPAYPFIQAGIALASGLANVQNIRKQQFSGGSGGGSFGGGGGVPGGGGAAPQIEPVTNTSTLLSQDAQKVYVTETDISETQNKVSVIEAQSTF